MHCRSTAAYLCLAVLSFASAADQPAPAELTWLDARTLPLEGKGWADTKSFYDRLPRQAEGVVRQPVWDLSHDCAGLLFHFASDTPELRARWTLTSAQLASGNMSASGVSGLDLYVRLDGGWHWLAAVRPGASREGNEGVLFEKVPAERREFLLYLPLYNGIESLQFGIPGTRKLEAVASPGKPIVFYGTSIVQGGSAMRPGMAYPAIIGRRLDRAVVNLGFSGNGRAEPEMASLLAQLDPAAYVLDCLPNLAWDQVQRLEPFVGILRQRHPATPIFLVENLEYPDGAVIQARRMGYDVGNQELREIFTRLSLADRNLHLVPAKDLIGSDGEATVDGVHPTDLGTMRMADKIEPLLRGALGGP
ncbi:MAG TPA: SGNH/GDSL hydrolase family protein [Opitutaceae bacterium]|nr:SGNH/GDSL hydrolase family protein [Opitutaceae bacterium]